MGFGWDLGTEMGNRTEKVTARRSENTRRKATNSEMGLGCSLG